MPEPREHPILFSTPMVRAILEGRKTQTRRLVRNVPDRAHTFSRCEADGSWIIWCGKELIGDYAAFTQRAYPRGGGVLCPYGVPGDRLWVKEAWRVRADQDHIAPRDLPRGSMPWYCATGNGHGDEQPSGCAGGLGKKRPSLFMMRWASRLLLELTEVRVQRLQEISLDDARAEGATRRDGEHGGGWSLDWSRVGEPSQWAADRKTLSVQDVCLGSPQMAFGNAWNAINGKRAPWASNPFVWCLTFKVIGDNR